MANRNRLQVVVDEIEALEAEKAEIVLQIKEKKTAAAAEGFSKAILNKVLKRRKMTDEQRDEEDALTQIYEGALGMLGGTPLGEAALRRLAQESEEAKADLGDDTLYEKAKALVLTDRKASTSYIQRRLQIGYNLAASFVERMEREGVIGPANASGKREILDGGSQQATTDGAEAKDEPDQIDADVSEDEARAKGAAAAQAGVKVTANPYPPRTPQRAWWDEAWCQAAGSDGMDLPPAWRPNPKPKKGKGDGEGGDQ